ncbi:MAG TPA: LysR family transcriptional regulator [Stellaceae bacterium]|jgi:DNA-binding transcriptional LysR family regulator|nr:LysR family transcriptional regulator [Stellaceae bacterium]
MRQDQLDGLVAFTCVAELQSFSAAAVRLGVSPSAVSQTIRGLEMRLGVPLFNRTTRSVSLTEAGLRYLERVAPAIQELSAAAEELGDDAARPSGLLRLNVPRAAYMIVLQPILRAFLTTYREIDLEISIDNQLVDIVGRGFDAGIRFGDLVERDMVGVKIGPSITAHVVASPDYIARHGMPKSPRDLLSHDCIGFRHATTGQVERWCFIKDEEEVELAVSGRLILNDSAALVQAALDGLGIAYMINGYIERFLDDGRLIRLLPEWSPPLAGLMLYYADRRRVPRKLRALIGFLRRDLSGGPPMTDGVII